MIINDGACACRLLLVFATWLMSLRLCPLFTYLFSRRATHRCERAHTTQHTMGKGGRGYPLLLRTPSLEVALQAVSIGRMERTLADSTFV